MPSQGWDTTIEGAALAKKHAAETQSNTIEEAQSGAEVAPPPHDITETSGSMGTGGLYHDHEGIVHKHTDSYVRGAGSSAHGQPPGLLQTLWHKLSGQEIK